MFGLTRPEMPFPCSDEPCLDKPCPDEPCITIKNKRLPTNMIRVMLEDGIVDKIFKFNGLVYGPYVVSLLLRECHMKIFDQHGADNLKYWDTSVHPESKYRAIPCDGMISAVFKSIDDINSFKNSLVENSTNEIKGDFHQTRTNYVTTFHITFTEYDIVCPIKCSLNFINMPLTQRDCITYENYNYDMFALPVFYKIIEEKNTTPIELLEDIINDIYKKRTQFIAGNSLSIANIVDLIEEGWAIGGLSYLNFGHSDEICIMCHDKENEEDGPVDVNLHKYSYFHRTCFSSYMSKFAEVFYDEHDKPYFKCPIRQKCHLTT